MDYFSDNKVRIGDKNIQIYLGQCDKRFKKYPKVILEFCGSYSEKSNNLANIKEFVGIKKDESNINNKTGKLKIKSETRNDINSKTGKREKKIYYQITLKRIENLRVDNLEDYEWLPLKESKPVKEENNDNEIKIAENNLDFYLGQCDIDFQSFDQLILITTEEYIQTIEYIIKILNNQGIQISEDYINRDNKEIFFHYFEKDIINSKTGRKERKKFYKIEITKCPDLFMFTDPDTALEIE